MSAAATRADAALRRTAGLMVCEHARMPHVQCLACRTVTDVSSASAVTWDCACGGSYVFRRCGSCGMASQVRTLQKRGQPWPCQWCREANTGYTPRNDPATATVADFSADMASHGLQFTVRQPRQEQARDIQPVLIVTTNDIPGYRITKVHGDVFGLIVMARNYFSNMGASFRTLVGGEVAGYTTLLVDSRNQARDRMWREARARGANAIVAMRFDCNEIGGIMSEIAAYGTAVTVEPVPPAQP